MDVGFEADLNTANAGDDIRRDTYFVDVSLLFKSVAKAVARIDAASRASDSGAELREIILVQSPFSDFDRKPDLAACTFHYQGLVCRLSFYSRDVDWRQLGAVTERTAKLYERRVRSTRDGPFTERELEEVVYDSREYETTCRLHFRYNSDQ